MATQRKADSFGTFLGTVQGKTTDLNPQVKLLQVLLAFGPTPIPKIAEASGLEISTFLETLRVLQELRLVTADDDVVTLTQPGKDIAEKAT